MARRPWYSYSLSDAEGDSAEEVSRCGIEEKNAVELSYRSSTVKLYLFVDEQYLLLNIHDVETQSPCRLYQPPHSSESRVLAYAQWALEHVCFSLEARHWFQRSLSGPLGAS